MLTVLPDRLTFSLDGSENPISEDSKNSISCDALMSIGEVALTIFSFLDQPSLGHSAQVCRQWNVLTQDNSLWKLIADSRGFQVDPKKTELVKSQVKQIQEDRKNGIDVVKSRLEFVNKLFEIYKNADTNRITGIHYFPVNNPCAHIYVRIGNLRRMNLSLIDDFFEMPGKLFLGADSQYILKGEGDAQFHKGNMCWRAQNSKNRVGVEVVCIGIDEGITKHHWLNVHNILECNTNPTKYDAIQLETSWVLDSCLLEDFLKDPQAWS
ncbi:MAG: hypothetical protein CK425_09155 [Parachlamydia sp.]|nr:MAG: hypothetical protein CK425_09155 [Parachlamydia sp.]